MDIEDLWTLIETARSEVAVFGEADGGDGGTAERAKLLLARRPAEDIVRAEQLLWDLMVDSYRAPLWAAAYTINGGCSDDGFDYFRGWLIVQGRSVFDRAVADPDTLADHPAVRAAAEKGIELEDEETLHIVWNAHLAATGKELPPDAFSIRYPALDDTWAFDFDDAAEITRRLPRLAALFLA